ncbi:Mor transcription activator family protein [Hydrogenovibrio sp. 3SP14C1]|uniref:Mor transcription activator family protein n=1 Tax=Hydrogenovibrio sp. 3SP14C1 TaxID=3038774 RepID=UPI00241793D4|nr:Mor transcription activator family protein [Hydrogenovibrio sp. 3SP14C1]MDG4811678.1 Mor transcription activator family protein [Hydrogenovibrio sp. 3SP14C1]
MSENQLDLLGDEISASIDEILKHSDDLDIEDIKQRWPARLVEIFDVISMTLDRKACIQGSDKSELASVIVTAIAFHFGGRNFYLPSNEKLERAIRDIQIWKDFTGNNIPELSKKYKLSEVSIHNVLATQRKIRHDKVQPKLF